MWWVVRASEVSQLLLVNKQYFRTFRKSLSFYDNGMIQFLTCAWNFMYSLYSNHYLVISIYIFILDIRNIYRQNFKFEFSRW